MNEGASQTLSKLSFPILILFSLFGTILIVALVDSLKHSASFPGSSFCGHVLKRNDGTADSNAIGWSVLLLQSRLYHLAFSSSCRNPPLVPARVAL